MSFERWIRCDGCGNALPLKDHEGVPGGWIGMSAQPEEDAPEEKRERYSFFFLEAKPEPPAKHLCSWTCVEKIGSLTKAAA